MAVFLEFQLFLLNVERGDLAGVKRIVSALIKKKNIFEINCVDPLGRSGLVIAIENENMEMMQYLLEVGIELRVSYLVWCQLSKFDNMKHRASDIFYTSYSNSSCTKCILNFSSYFCRLNFCPV